MRPTRHPRRLLAWLVAVSSLVTLALLAGQLWRFGGQAAFAVSGFIALAACGVAWYWLLRRRPRAALETA